MNFPYFISGRLSKDVNSSFTSIISKLAVVSITLSLSAMILAYFILGGFQKTVRDKIYNFKGHLEITKYTLGSSFDDNFIRVDTDFIEGLHHYEFVDHTQSFAYKAGMLKTQEEVEGVGLKGVSHDFDTLRFKENMVEGRFIAFTDSAYSKEVVLSRRIANKLRLHVGDKVTVYFVQNPPKFRRLEIVGLYETGLEEIDKSMVLADIDLIRRLNNWDDTQVGGVEIFVKDGYDMDQAEETMYADLDSYLYVDKVKEKYMQIFDWLDLLSQNVSVFLILILVVACFNMVSILLILIMERTYMIGVFQAIGATRQQIKRVFLYNGMRLVLQGLLFGNGAALLFAFVQDRFHLIPLDPVNYYMSFVPIQWNFEALIYLNALTFVIVLLALRIPLMVITKVNPVTALKFD
ncbi:ABC transporter permease [Reichenbachiella agarivorans]|uniref:ABC transporter permease n=1 Tax=Reichenbachiella agarivorans TaxID=2979464 RepID=A0ABY6CLU8_9BACT|nr:ABC transporter permease [Reichenbachiella agarivorans]UXP31369.1 ABC transporter permease [Reichenbachiella agarivorans]